MRPEQDPDQQRSVPRFVAGEQFGGLTLRSCVGVEPCTDAVVEPIGESRVPIHLRPHYGRPLPTGGPVDRVIQKTAE